jgi:mRNA interferase RelE/StbE
VARYRLFIKPSAAKEIEAIPAKKDRRRILARIESLATDPCPAGCEKLTGSDRRYRIRQGRYRVVYDVDDAVAEIAVVKVGHRRDVYR